MIAAGCLWIKNAALEYGLRFFLGIGERRKGKMDLTGLTLHRVLGALRIHSIHRNHFPPRSSDAFVFYLSGECTYAYEGLSFRARAGDFVYLPKGRPYTAHFIAPVTSCLLVNFEAASKEERAPLCRRPENPGQIQALFEAIVRQDLRQERNSQPWMLSSLYQLIALMEAPLSYLPGSQKEKLKKALAQIDQEYCCPDLRCAHLAQSCRMSEKYFQQLFKSAYGIAPSQYIAQKRLQKARRMLVESDEAISTIAQSCGYGSLYYFSRVFKAAVGESPSEYRKNASIT